MEILRVPPYPISTTWELPQANTDYVLYIEDLVDHSVEQVEVTSNSSSQVIYELPQSRLQFDRKFLIRFYDLDGNIVYDSNLDIIRPYVDPKLLGTTASEIAEYKMLELVARSLIDTVIQDGFYNHKQVIQDVGQGTDYYPIWSDNNKVLKVYENNILVYDVDDAASYDVEYRISLDNSSIIKVVSEQYNRLENKPLNLPVATGDLAFLGRQGAHFPKGYDYIFIVDTGYKAVPPDVEYAAKLLIDDLKCGRLDYYQRYVSSYGTDQIKVQFDKSFFSGTGNMLVDKILDKYKNNIPKVGLI